MRGIQINNYFNNHITLNGRKISNENQGIPHVNRPKPLIINHIHNNESPEPLLITQSKSPVMKQQNGSNRKKRTNTLGELKKNEGKKRSISLERLKKGISSSKKKESNSEDQQTEKVNLSQKKLKGVAIKSEGLGKRSKSTIIKNTIVSDTQRENSKEFIKKQVKKGITSNHTNESQGDLKAKKKKSIKNASSKDVKLSKQPSNIKASHKNLNIKFDKFSSQKKSARSYVNNKSSVVSAKQSKPVSARERKGIKKGLFNDKNAKKFFQDLKQRYQNQDIIQKSEGVNFINGIKELKKNQSNQFEGEDEEPDENFIIMMNNLEKALNSVGSKTKLKKELQLIQQKLKQFKVSTQNEEMNCETQRETVSNFFKKNVEIDGGYIRENQSYEEKEETQNISQEDSEDQRLKPQKLYDSQNRLDQQQQSQQKQSIQKQEKDIHDQNNIFLREEEQNIKNPMLDRRLHNNFFNINYQPQVQPQIQDFQVKNSRKKQIELLKMFKDQSNKMMQKVGLNVHKEEISSANKIEQKIEQIPKADYHKLTISIARQDKYPSAVNLLRSPKFNEQQLMGMISLKQKFISNKHDKMNELVNKMYQKQIVSPKSFQFQIFNLKKKYQEQNEALQSVKRQAQQISSILSQIKKDKEEIHDIDELIRNQKWEQAQQFMHLSDKKYESQWKQVDIKRSDINQKQKSSKQMELIAELNNRRSEISHSIQHNKTQQSQQQPDPDITQYYSKGNNEQYEQKQYNEINQQELQGYIYYQGEESEEVTKEKNKESKVIRLFEIVHQPDEVKASKPQFPDNVIHINEDADIIPENPPILQNNSMLSNPSSVSNKDRKGFDSNLYFIKEYCIGLCEYVRDHQSHKRHFKENISKMIEFDMRGLLSMYRTNSAGMPTHSYNSIRQQLAYFGMKRSADQNAISQKIFNEFNGSYEPLKYFNMPSVQSQKFTFQKEAESIFLQSIYQALNESLNYERPGGSNGRPFPWHNESKHLKNLKYAKIGSRQFEQKQGTESYDLIFGVAIARIIQWGSCLCGFLPDTVELQNTQIDEEYVNHIRQTRMAFLLQKMLLEEQALLSNMEMQELEVDLQLGEVIYKELLNEVTREMEQINNKKGKII